MRSRAVFGQGIVLLDRLERRWTREAMGQMWHKDRCLHRIEWEALVKV